MAEAVKTAERSASERPVVVSAVGLTKVFRDFWNRPKAKAVNDIDFEVREGEVVGLLGPNGSGKSTTVKMLLGLLYPTGGRLTVFGKSPRDVENKKLIGYLPEETYLYKYLTAFETLDFFASLFGLSKEERTRRCDQLLDMVGLAHARNRPVGEFSKGMARRIGLAQAMINDPAFLILDEPTSGLDPLGCREVKDLIKLLKKRGKTVIVTSHLLSDVEEVCDRIIARTHPEDRPRERPGRGNVRGASAYVAGGFLRGHRERGEEGKPRNIRFAVGRRHRRIPHRGRGPRREGRA